MVAMATGGREVGIVKRVSVPVAISMDGGVLLLFQAGDQLKGGTDQVT